MVPESVETKQCCRYVPCWILEVRTVVFSVVLMEHLVLALLSARLPEAGCLRGREMSVACTGTTAVNFYDLARLFALGFSSIGCTLVATRPCLLRAFAVALLLN